MSDYSPVRVLLEYEMDNSVNVVGLDADGFIAYEVPIGNVQNAEEAKHLAEKNGWSCDYEKGDWFDGKLCQFVDLFPTNAKIGIVGSEMTQDSVKEVLQKSNIEFGEIVSITSSPEEGKTYVVASVLKPINWSWHEQTTV
jgi:hypothetical protein